MGWRPMESSAQKPPRPWTFRPQTGCGRAGQPWNEGAGPPPPPPARLAREAIRPKVNEIPGSLEAQNIRVFRDWSAGAPEIDRNTVDWSRVEPESLAYKFQQLPGPLNSLGQIKFVFPNKFDVYLHDTPAKDLFKKPVRDFSSGCIRVERPIELAAYLLADDTEWNG